MAPDPKIAIVVFSSISPVALAIFLASMVIVQKRNRILKELLNADMELTIIAAFSGLANAENNHALDVDRLFVKEAYVGKAIVMKRFKARARGRGARILKPFSHLTIVVGERGDQ